MQPDALELVEHKLLCRAISEACRLLASGDAAAGRQCLQTGLERACEHAATGDPWAAELVRSYGAALDSFSSLSSQTYQRPVESSDSFRRRAGRGASTGVRP